METDEHAHVLRAVLEREGGNSGLPGGPVGVPFVGSGSGDRAGGWHQQEAELLRHAERCRRPETLLSHRRSGGLSLLDAYLVQWYGVALRVRDGARIVGHKVGLTSKAMQDQVGIDTPDSGILLDYMAVPTGGTLQAAELLSPRAEAEIAFRLKTDLYGVEVTEQVARESAAEVFLALEIIDCRVGTDGITLADSVADNAACARFVLGAPVPMGACDLRTEELTVQVGAACVAVGVGRDVLGDPIRSVVWLAHQLASFDAGLKAGDVVLAGAVHASIPLPIGATVSASSPHLPAVSLRVA